MIAQNSAFPSKGDLNWLLLCMNPWLVDWLCGFYHLFRIYYIWSNYWIDVLVIMTCEEQGMTTEYVELCLVVLVWDVATCVPFLISVIQILKFEKWKSKYQLRCCLWVINNLSNTSSLDYSTYVLCFQLFPAWYLIEHKKLQLSTSYGFQISTFD
jgi:hypothetical protein